VPTNVLMPALSPTMEEGTLARWLVKEGDSVEIGDVIAEIETDKATMEVEATEDGVIGKLVVDEGTEHVSVNDPIAIILEDGESVGDADLAADPVQTKAPPPPSSPASEHRQERSTEPERQHENKAPAQPEPARPAREPREPQVLQEPEAPEGTRMKELSVREALRDAIAEEMRRDETVFLMGEEVAEYEGAYKVSQGLLDEFGARRVIDTPITEHGFAGLGVGAAFGGLRPIIEFMTFNFAMQAIDHLINSAAKTLYMSGGQMGCPIVFRGPNGAAARVGAQHSQDYAAWYAHIPGLKVVAPHSAADAKGLLKSAIRDPNPVVFLENEILYGQKSDVPLVDDWIVPIGKARIVRPGDQVTIVAYSRCVDHALKAADDLSEQGIKAEVIDLRTLRPLDIGTVITSVRKTNRLVTVEECWGPCGIGAEVAAQVMDQAFDYLDAPVARVHQEDVPLPYAANLEALSLPNPEKVITAARRVCYAD